ncbi:MAG: hypothetical protein WC323_02480 [Patescibacteria group bacterium]|jgi:hypothetical protein
MKISEEEIERHSKKIKIKDKRKRKKMRVSGASVKKLNSIISKK